MYFKIFGLMIACCTCAAQQQNSVVHFPVKVVEGIGQQQGQSVCPAAADLQVIRSTITQEVGNILQSHPNYNNCACGGAGDWRRIAFLNMSDPNEQCPSNWRFITSPVRACGKSTHAAVSGCDSAIFPSDGRTYSQVCGRIIGYQKATTDAFLSAGNGLNSNYVDGVSITHGAAGSRRHIWTFAGALYEMDPDYSTYRRFNCPCTNTNYNWPYQIPSFVGNDYFCDTGNPGPGFGDNRAFTDDPLWDGAGCGPTNACCEFNNPPWFCKTLPQPTSDDLEIRICNSEALGFEDTPVTLIDIAVQ